MEDTYGAEDEVAIITDLGLIPLSDVSTQQTSSKQAEAEIDVVVQKSNKRSRN